MSVWTRLFNLKRSSSCLTMKSSNRRNWRRTRDYRSLCEYCFGEIKGTVSDFWETLLVFEINPNKHTPPLHHTLPKMSCLLLVTSSTHSKLFPAHRAETMQPLCPAFRPSCWGLVVVSLFCKNHFQEIVDDKKIWLYFTTMLSIFCKRHLQIFAPFTNIYHTSFSENNTHYRYS